MVEQKWRGWKEGIASSDIISAGGSGHRKGETIRYRRKKVIEFHGEVKLTDYEWHYVNTSNSDLVRTTELTIEGQPHIKEPYIKYERLTP